MSKCTDLLYIENILHLFLNDNIFTIKLLGGKFNDEIINQMYKTLEIFYNICKKNNKKFYHIYDFSNCKLINAPNYINYVNSINQKNIEVLEISGNRWEMLFNPNNYYSLSYPEINIEQHTEHTKTENIDRYRTC